MLPTSLQQLSTIIVYHQLAAMKPDAFIISDPGVLTIAKQTNIPLHLSVQQNNVNWKSAEFWHQQGIERIILARELTLQEIQTIQEKNPTLEVELFIHGAICMAYSGRCLLSNYLTGRDANQGACAQSCRWQYKVLEEALRPNEHIPIEEDSHGTYILNSRDLCALHHIKQLINMKVESFKIEGRNKGIYYVAITAKVYREVIDALTEGRTPDYKKLQEELETTGNRGYIPGFFDGRPEELGQRYDSNKVLQTHTYIGECIANTETTATFKVRNRIDVNDILEVITPTETFFIEIKSINEDNKPIHPGQGTITIDFKRTISKFALLRREGQQKRS